MLNCIKYYNNKHTILEWIQFVRSKRENMTPSDEMSALKILNEYYQNQSYTDVISHSLVFIKKFPKQIEFLNIAGTAYRNLKQFEAAINSFKKALQLQPRHAGVWLNMGVAQKDMGDLSGAVESYRRCIQLKPDYALAYFNLANTQKLLGDIEQAVKNYEFAIHYNPNIVQLYFNFANTLKDLERFGDAIFIYQRGLELNPNHVDLLLNLGNCQKYRGDFRSAEASYRRAIEIDPKSVQGHFNLGNTLFEAGDPEGAAKSYKAALELKPDFAECYRCYAMVGKLAADTVALNRMASAMSAPEASEADKILYHFAIAKVAEQSGDAESCVSHLDAGNALKRRLSNYNLSRDRNLFSSIKQYFRTREIEDMPKNRTENISGRTPIFILGMPRSGTSLIEQILSSHTDVYGAGELEALDKAVQGSHWTGNGSHDEAFASIRKIYLQALTDFPATRFITDKMPLNFQWIGFILRAIPGAKIIHTRRNPMAVCWSNYKTHFPAIGLAFGNSQTDIAEYYHLYEDLMEFWRTQFPDCMYEIDYEALTSDQETETRKLANFLGLPWQKSLLNFHLNHRTVTTASSLQVRKQMYSGSSEEWRKYAQWLQPMIQSLGGNMPSGPAD